MSVTGTQGAFRWAAIGEVFRAFLGLGLTSFGGPVAHLGYFRDAFVTRRRWLDDGAYADIVALCQMLPGPASSQVGMALGLGRAGIVGALAAWAGFTLPSAAAMIAFAYLVGHVALTPDTAWAHGLKVAAAAVVANAAWNMARNLCPDALRATLAGVATLIVLALPGASGQLLAIVLGALVGWRFVAAPEQRTKADAPARTNGGAGVFWFVMFFVLLALLPVLADLWPNHMLALLNRFYRAGALVFGGGHVVLPLLQAAVVPPGWIDNGTFLAGYGAAQSLPGPLFSFAAFLGTAMSDEPRGWPGGLLCLAAIYLPSFLLLFGAWPFWLRLSGNAAVKSALAGVNAVVVGLLLAALYDPVWTSAIRSRSDFALALVALLALAVWRAPPWAVVLGAAGAAAALAAVQ